MPAFTEYNYNNKIYIDLKQLLPLRPYAAGCKSIKDLVKKKEFKDTIIAQVVDNVLEIKEKRSYRHNSLFVCKDEIMDLYAENTPEIVEYPMAPPVIQDDDLIFFKDEDGNEYDVLMRGERTRKGIYFRVKDIESVFQMKRIDDIVSKDHTKYNEQKDYQWFNLQNADTVRNGRSKEMYLTYSGLKHMIESSRSGIGYKFKEWIDEIVFAAAFGTKDQKAEAFARTLNTDAEHLKAVMNKCIGDISCLYLIDIQQTDGDKRIFKYGYTKHLTRRFREHMKKYGDNAELIKFVFVPETNLSRAEKQIKDITQSYSYQREGEQELLALNDKELASVILVYQSIAANHSGQLNLIVSKYEADIAAMQMSHALELSEFQRKHERLTHEMEMKMVIATKDNEILQMRVQMLEAQLNASK